MSSLSAIRTAHAATIASATLTVPTNGEGFVEITRELARFLEQAKARDGMLLSMLDGVSLHVPIAAGALRLGTWQGVYLAEHRRAPHRREVILQFVGSYGEE